MARKIEIPDRVRAGIKFVITTVLFVAGVIFAFYFSAPNNLHSLFSAIGLLPPEIAVMPIVQIIANVVYLAALFVFGLLVASLCTSFKIISAGRGSYLDSLRFFIYALIISIFTNIAYAVIRVEGTLLFYEPMWNIVSLIQFLVLIFTLVHIVYSETTNSNILVLIVVFGLMYICAFALYVNIINLAFTFEPRTSNALESDGAQDGAHAEASTSQDGAHAETSTAQDGATAEATTRESSSQNGATSQGGSTAQTGANPLPRTAPPVPLRIISRTALVILATWENDGESAELLLGARSEANAANFNEEALRSSLETLVLVLSIVSRLIFALVLGKFIHFLYRASGHEPK